MDDKDLKKIVHYKTYPRFQRIELLKDLDRTPLRDLIRERRTVRERSNEGIGIKTLHQLLDLAAGRTGSKGSGNQDFRGYPSAGARYPLEIYMAVFDIVGLDKGIYHYSPFDGSLEILWPGDFKDEIGKYLDGAIDDFDDMARAFLMISSIDARTTFKYGEEGRIFPYIEAGYLGANIIYLLQEIDVNTVVVGIQWCSKELGDLLDLNRRNEKVISGIIIL